MKKYLLIIAALCGAAAFAPAQTPAQPWGAIPNPPIIDITNLIRAIENGMHMYEQLQSIYEILKTNIKRIEEQIKAFEAFDIRELSLNDPLGSWKKIMTYGNRMMTYEENIEAILNRKDIKIGNASYSLADLYMTDLAKNIVDMVGGAAGYVIIDPFEKQLTTEEKAVFHQKYGMSYGHYIRYHKIGEALSKKAAEITAYNGILDGELATDREAIKSMSGDNDNTSFGGTDSGESWVQEQQKINVLLTVKNQELKTKTKLIADIATLYANNAVKASEAPQKINDADLGENYLKILEKTGKKNDFMGHLYPEQ
jgi:hypothetical protein